MNKHSEMLAKESIGRLLMKLSAPAMVGMLVQALYNIVDTIFVGRSIGYLGIAGLTIVFPIQILVMAFAQTVGIGGASIISRSLGAGKNDHADNTFGNIISLLMIISAVVMLLGGTFMIPILKIFGATENILPYSLEYLRVILFGIFFFIFAVAVNNVVRAEGNAKVAMVTMLISAGLNIILDPIFIFSFNMGIRGAALATVLSQASMAVYLVYYFLTGKSTLKFKTKYLKFNLNILRETLAIGASSFARQASGSFMAVIINITLAFYGGDIAIAVFGVINRLLMFALMPMFGIVQGLQPIVGFNYGAYRLDRVRRSIKLAILVTTGMSTIAFLVFMISPGFFVSLFSKEQELINTATEAIRIIVLAFPLVGFQLIGTGIYQAIGKALPALVLSLSRQVLFFIPLVLILPLFFKLQGVWLSFPLADLLSFAVTFILVKEEMKLLKEKVSLAE
ncbi:MAG: MATE family efflux transporter [Firmicutes bacterium HGW-Firmicutes-13]|nr:MAG: MATE family efflux transporter [Firmicutes bacterium HGW-Firmicutes-13]